ncbi:MAG: hypothetical protein MZV63_46815 [Marinilabiliales bacterium]|nr:hypothetical protein [Marinilabiliales bacterium]
MKSAGCSGKATLSALLRPDQLVSQGLIEKGQGKHGPTRGEEQDVLPGDAGRGKAPPRRPIHQERLWKTVPQTTEG